MAVCPRNVAGCNGITSARVMAVTASHAMCRQVGLRLLNATNIAVPVGLLTRHRDKVLASKARALASKWHAMASAVRFLATEADGV